MFSVLYKNTAQIEGKDNVNSGYFLKRKRFPFLVTKLILIFIFSVTLNLFIVLSHFKKYLKYPAFVEVMMSFFFF